MKAPAILLFGALSLVAQAPSAWAQASGDKAVAEALFQQGLELMKQGRNAEACPKLAESLRIEAGVGVRLYLGECYERVGQVASAWAMFKEAAATARAAGQADREKTALERAAAVERRVPKLVISAASGTEGLVIKRNGTLVTPALVGTPLPVDPGVQTVEASAPGKKTWSVQVEVKEGGRPLAVSVPPLETGSDGPRSAWSTQKTLSLVAGGVGVAGIVVGAVFGIKTFGAWSDAKGDCAGKPLRCGPTGLGSASDASTFGTVSTIGFGVGAAALAGGVVLWITAPSSPKAESAPSPTVGVGPGSLTVSGRF